MVWLSISSFTGGGNKMQTNGTPVLPNANPCQTKMKGLDVNRYANQRQILCKPKLKTRQFQLENLFKEQINASEIIHTTQAFIDAG